MDFNNVSEKKVNDNLMNELVDIAVKLVDLQKEYNIDKKQDIEKDILSVAKEYVFDLLPGFDYSHYEFDWFSDDGCKYVYHFIGSIQCLLKSCGIQCHGHLLKMQTIIRVLNKIVEKQSLELRASY